MNKIILITSLCLLIGSCGQDFKRSMGLTKTGPNEYAVLKNPPLHVPPKFDLTPPEDQKKKSIYLASSKKTSSIALGEKQDAQLPEDQEISLTEADQKFIDQTIGFDKNPNIKNVINAEYQTTKSKDPKKTKTLMSIFSKN